MVTIQALPGSREHLGRKKPASDRSTQRAILRSMAICVGVATLVRLAKLAAPADLPDFVLEASHGEAPKHDTLRDSAALQRRAVRIQLRSSGFRLGNVKCRPGSRSLSSQTNLLVLFLVFMLTLPRFGF